MLKDEIKELSDDTLREMLQINRGVLTMMDETHANVPELTGTVFRLFNDSPDGNMLKTFNSMAAADPDMMQRVLQQSISSYMIHHCIFEVGKELKRRAARHN